MADLKGPWTWKALKKKDGAETIAIYFDNAKVVLDFRWYPPWQNSLMRKNAKTICRDLNAAFRKRAAPEPKEGTMACPTCDHTMERIHTCRADEVLVFQCPRCGTTKVEDSGAEEPAVYVPALVERCREFEAAMKELDLDPDAWHRLGIAESIHTPEKRRPT